MNYYKYKFEAQGEAKGAVRQARAGDETARARHLPQRCEWRHNQRRSLGIQENTVPHLGASLFRYLLRVAARCLKTYYDVITDNYNPNGNPCLTQMTDCTPLCITLVLTPNRNPRPTYSRVRQLSCRESTATFTGLGQSNSDGGRV